MTEFSRIQTKKARVAFIRAKLATNPMWALKGLVRIYEAQTADEKSSGVTIAHNGVGFSGKDAEFLSDLAKKYQRYGTLSDKQIACVLKAMPSYAAQLERVADPYTPSPSPEAVSGD